ncbi:MAG: outer membrane protein assembly factor BamA [Planctomycetes bacterium]|nr:outer membrane protein assembly factor BamA [Planctomycetota bacterium]
MPESRSALRLLRSARRIPAPFALALLALAFAPVLTAQAPPAPPAAPAGQVVVRKIQIVGLETGDPIVVTARLQTREGQPFNTDTFQADVRRLYATGLFSNIEWEPPTETNGFTLILRLTETQRVAAVEYANVKNIREKKLNERLRLKVGEPVSEYLMKLDADMIVDEYKNEGFAFAAATPEVVKGDRGATVRFVVREGPKVKIREVSFTGHTAFDEGDLEDVCQKIQEPSLFASHVYKEEDLADDVERLKMYYRAHGWLDARTVVESVTFTPDKEKVDVVFHVDEGQRYMVQFVTITGNTVYTAEEIQKDFRTKPGQAYDGGHLDNDMEVIRSMYGEKAYVEAQVDLKTQFTQTPGEIALEFTVNEGKPITVEKITVVGNTKTQDKVVRRELKVYPGEELNSRKLRQSFDRLQALGYFSNVNVRTETGSQPDTRNLTLEVEETTTGALRFGGGVSSNSGVIGILELSQRNFDIADPPKSFSDFVEGTAFAGAGQALRISFEPGTERTRFGVDFREPYFFGYPLGLNLGVFGYDRNRFFYREKRTGGGVGVDYRFEETPWVIGADTRFERLQIRNVDADSPRGVFEVEGTSSLHTISPWVSYDRRDSIVAPSSGHMIRLSYENAGSWVGGDYDFNKLVLGVDKYFTVFTTSTKGKHVLWGNVRLGWADAYGNDNDLPIFERFYAGGSGTVRGFQFRTISPKERKEPIGGDALVVANLEYTFPIYRPEERGKFTDVLRGAVFLDTGAVAADWGALEGDDFRVSTGLGVRFSLPFLGNVPVSLDFGFPLKQRPGDDEQFFHINLGQQF